MAANTSIVGKYVASVDVAGAAGDGVIDVTFKSGAPTNSHIFGKHLVFSPVTHAGSIEWNCNVTGTTVENKYRPTVCRD